MVTQPTNPFNVPCPPPTVPPWSPTAVNEAQPQEPAPDPGSSIDAVIAAAVGAIGEDSTTADLDHHVRTLCQALVGRNASGVVTNAALDQVNQRLASLKRTRLTKSQWAARLKEAAATLAVMCPQEGDPTGPEAMVRVRDVLADAPVPDAAVVPGGWKLTPSGVYEPRTEGDVEVLPAPLVVAARLTGAEQSESLRLAWFRDGSWKERVCPRDTV